MNSTTESSKPAKPTKDEKDAAWLSNKILFIRGLKNPSDQLALLLLLSENPARTPDEDKLFAALVRAEKASERARSAQSEANRILKAEASAERKRRDHELYKVAGLLGLVGLVDKKTGKPLIDRGELTGALAVIAHTPPSDPSRIEWKKAGDAILSSAKEEGTADFQSPPKRL